MDHNIPTKALASSNRVGKPAILPADDFQVRGAVGGLVIDPVAYSTVGSAESSRTINLQLVVELLVLGERS